jgi:HEPN domain-containing protein
MEEKKLNYIRWQNRAFRFYIGARLLYLNEQDAPAAYCANQALELLLKATLVYWDRSFNPVNTGHKIAKMLRTISNKVPDGNSFSCPEYLWTDEKYLSTTRYPSQSGRGFGVPGSFLEDIDKIFNDLVLMTPFQWNSNLKQALQGRNKKNLSILRRQNTYMRSLRKNLNVRLRK